MALAFYHLERALAMAPCTYIEISPERKEQKQLAAETLVLGPREAGVVPSAKIARVTRFPEEGSFESSMLEYNRMKSGKKWVNMLISLSINCAILILPLFLALYFTDTLDLKQFTSTFLVAPPPPPPPRAIKIVNAASPHKVFENSGRLMAPRAIPKDIAVIKERPLPPDADGAGVEGGVPGGVSGGSIGGVIGGVIGGISSAVPAPLVPKREGPKTPVRVGGRVKEPKLTNRVDPVYPALAKQTHLQGTVVIEAIIDEHGEVSEMKVVSGPPLLIPSAMDALRRWRYEPTYLNEEPVPVRLNVIVNFQLSD